MFAVCFVVSDVGLGRERWKPRNRTAAEKMKNHMVGFEQREKKNTRSRRGL